MRRARPGFVLAYLAPAGLLYGVFVLWPLIQTLALSPFEWRGLSGQKRFVGGANFVQAFSDETYRQALTNAGIALLIMLPLLTGLGLVLAHVLEGDDRMTRWARAVYLSPHMVAVVAVGVIWLFLYNPSIGLFRGAGPENGWLGTPSTALLSVLAAFLWYAVGFYALLYGAGLRQISPEVRESSKLDGATGWVAFWRITWPLLWSIRRVALPYIVVNVLSIFALVMVMTGGGQPDRHTEMPLTLLYERAMEHSEFSYAITMGAINFALALAVTGVLMFLMRKNPEQSHA